MEFSGKDKVQLILALNVALTGYRKAFEVSDNKEYWESEINDIQKLITKFREAL